jgi:hypothetical protein
MREAVRDAGQALFTADTDFGAADAADGGGKERVGCECRIAQGGWSRNAGHRGSFGVKLLDDKASSLQSRYGKVRKRARRDSEESDGQVAEPSRHSGKITQSACLLPRRKHHHGAGED